MLGRLCAFLPAFFFTTVVILGSFITSAQAEGPLCVDIFASPNTNTAIPADPLPISSLLDPNLKPFKDFYGRGDHQIYFWNYHKNYGVMRTANDRLVLVAKNQNMAKQLLEDLAVYTKIPATNATSVRGPGWFFRRSASYDITAMLPELLRDRLEITGKRDGPNCINACLVIAGQRQSLIYSSRKELSHWMHTPFAKTITNARDLRPGDILFIHGEWSGGARQLVHVAIYVSPRLVLSKNGMFANRPLRLMDINEMAGLYMPVNAEQRQNFGPDYHHTLSAHRLNPIDEVLARRHVELPSSYVAAMNELTAFEARMQAMHDGHILKEVMRAEMKAIQANLLPLINREIRDIEASTTLNYDKKDLLEAMWEGLHLRIEADHTSLIHAD